MDTTSYEAARWVYLPLPSYGWSAREPLPRRPAPTVEGNIYVITEMDEVPNFDAPYRLSPKAAADLKEGLESAKKGAYIYLGSFSHHAEMDEVPW